MYRVDDTCYRMSLQCHRCLHKSSEHYRIHRADIKAARAMRERVIERLMCVCGTSVYTRHREKHLQSNRHQTVVAILRHRNALLASPSSSSLTAAGTPSADALATTAAETGLGSYPRDDEQQMAESDAEEHKSPSTPIDNSEPPLLAVPSPVAAASAEAVDALDLLL